MIYGNHTLSDGAELTFSDTIVGACVTRVDYPDVRYTGPDTPTVNSWENQQAGGVSMADAPPPPKPEIL